MRYPANFSRLFIEIYLMHSNDITGLIGHREECRIVVGVIANAIGEFWFGHGY